MSLLDRRQGFSNNGGNDSTQNDWIWSPEAYAIKWAIVAAIFLFFLIFFVGGYLHARRRMKRGVAPLSYHRWIVPARQRRAFYLAHPNLPESQRYQAQQQFSFYRPGYGDSRAAAQGPGYPMGPYGGGPPPPAYGQEDYVPQYTPPQGPNKTDPDQSYIQPPPGPPPGQQQTGTMGSGSGNQHGHPGGDLGQRM